MKSSTFIIGLLSGICIMLLGIVGFLVVNQQPENTVLAQAGGGNGDFIVGTAGSGANVNDIVYVVQKDAKGGYHLAVYKVENQNLTVKALREITWDLEVPEYKNNREMKVSDVRKEVEKVREQEKKRLEREKNN
jgi:hypothetical protein